MACDFRRTIVLKAQWYLIDLLDVTSSGDLRWMIDHP